MKTIVFDIAGVNADGSVKRARLLTCSPVNPVAAGCPHGSLPGTNSATDQSRPVSNFFLRITPDDSSSLGLYEHSILALTHVTLVSGLVSFKLSAPANIGILVQKVSGHRKLFGRTAPKLGKPGRVPLGSFKTGKRHAHWNLKVGGKKLGKGAYQVTVRALTRSGRIRDLGKPQLVHIH